MLSKSQVSFIKSLHQKKFRKEHGLFIAEGSKTVAEFIHSGYVVHTIYYTQQAAPKLLNLSQKIKLQEITLSELAKISALSAPQDVIALIHIPEETPIYKESFEGRFTLVLENVQDPGNLGTIIRTADWFGFDRLICSPDTVEAYNPKVVQATMGSLARIQVHYTDLEAILNHVQVPVFGALLNGTSIYKTDFGSQGILILGNEGNGISEKIQAYISQKVTIPRFGHAESLNVAVSAAIFCSKLRSNE